MAVAYRRMYWPWQDMSEIVGVLRSKGPWFDRNGGKDHIFVITADPGRSLSPPLYGWQGWHEAWVLKCMSGRLRSHIFHCVLSPAGRCQFRHDETKDSIFIHHFGMLDRVS